MIVLPLTLALMLLVLVARFSWPGLERLTAIEISGGLLVVLAYGVQLAGTLVQPLRLAALVISAGLLLRFCWLNRRFTGIIVAGAGAVLNMLVMAAQGGSMPVSTQTIAAMGGPTLQAGTRFLLSKSTVVAQDSGWLSLLNDRLLLPGPLGWFAAWSVGDLVLLAGVWWFLWQAMKGVADVSQRTDDHPLATSSTLPRA